MFRKIQQLCYTVRISLLCFSLSKIIQKCFSGYACVFYLFIFWIFEFAVWRVCWRVKNSNQTQFSIFELAKSSVWSARKPSLATATVVVIAVSVSFSLCVCLGVFWMCTHSVNGILHAYLFHLLRSLTHVPLMPCFATHISLPLALSFSLPPSLL